MRPERWNQIEGLFLQAVEMPSQERERFLGEVCQGDETLRHELNSLLACDVPETPLVKGSFLPPPSGPTNCVSSTVIDMAGRRIGPYRLVRLLGRGGMGSVHLAVRDDDQYKKEVAIKLLKRGMDTDFMLHRFRQERQILASLEHPFIARLIDGGATDDGLPYFVMEYVDGLPITKYCAEQNLDMEERLRLFRLVCEAVQYAHQHLVIHRDLKPGNILITQDFYGKALLADHEDAESFFLKGLGPAAKRWPFLRGRLLLGYGGWLRRQRRSVNARAPLREARDIFDALGASPWSDRAREELRASGEASRRRTEPIWEALTPQELHVAQLASEGLSNKEIGARLYLSHRTVGYHLHRIFSKTGITSRSGLGHILAGTGDAAG